MPSLYQRLREIEKNSLPAKAPSGATKNEKLAIQARCLQLKKLIHIIGFSFGSDLVPQKIERMGHAEKAWLRTQIQQWVFEIGYDTNLVKKIGQAAINSLNLELLELYVQLDGTLTSEERNSREQFIRAHTSSAETKHIEWKSFWTLEVAAVAVHAALILPEASIVAAASSATLGFFAGLGASLATGVYWFANQTRTTFVFIISNAATVLPILKIVGASVYGVLILPLFFKSLYKDLRNIFSLKYRAKRYDSFLRLCASLLLALAGTAIGVVMGFLALGGGPVVALALAGLGWMLGHYSYKLYKKYRDRKQHQGCSNPQKYHLTQQELESAIVEAQAPIQEAMRSLKADSSRKPKAEHALRITTLNLVKLCHHLESTAKRHKEQRIQKRNLLWALLCAVYGNGFDVGSDIHTRTRHQAIKALYALKRGRYAEFADCCRALGLKMGTNIISNNFEDASKQKTRYEISSRPNTLFSAPVYTLLSEVPYAITAGSENTLTHTTGYYPGPTAPPVLEENHFSEKRVPTPF